MQNKHIPFFGVSTSGEVGGSAGWSKRPTLAIFLKGPLILICTFILTVEPLHSVCGGGDILQQLLYQHFFFHYDGWILSQRNDILRLNHIQLFLLEKIEKIQLQLHLFYLLDFLMNGIE